jgi:energy-coupling factor transport system ATP-binding protein
VSSPGISLEGIVRKNGSFTLQADGTFQPGIHLLTGRVGSGKTTLGEILAGIEKPDQGVIRWEGTRRVMLLQDTSYHVSTITVQEEAASWCHDTRLIIARAGLIGKENADIFALSRGELRRLELAAILTGGYDLIILDEPYAGLDGEAREWVSQLIEDHSSQVVILISHDITHLPSIDILWELDNGVLTKVGSMPEGLTRWKRAPPLIRYLLNHGICPTGLSRQDLEEAVCRIQE